MTSKEKIDYVINKIREESEISPDPLLIEYKFTPEYLSNISNEVVNAEDEWKILQKLEAEKKLTFPLKSVLSKNTPSGFATSFDSLKIIVMRSGKVDLELKPEFINAIKKADEKILETEQLLNKLQTDINEKIKEQKQFEINEKEINYSDKGERKAWEKKWDVLQAIWTAYKTLNNPKNILVPVNALLIKGRDKNLIEMILSDYSRMGCFHGFTLEEDNYILYRVNHDKLKDVYKKTKAIWDKFTQVYQEKVKEENAILEGEKIKNQQLIQKIEIVDGKITIDGLQNSLKEIARVKKEEIKLRFPHKLPAGTKWEQFIIQFTNEESVFVQIRQFKENFSFKDMGFADTRYKPPRPNEEWILLKILAKYNGEITRKDPDAKDTYKKQKELLSKTLQSYFGIDFDPFYPYQDTKSYKVKMTLFFASSDERKPVIVNSEDAENELDEELRQFYNEQTPQKYEEDSQRYNDY